MTATSFHPDLESMRVLSTAHAALALTLALATTALAQTPPAPAPARPNPAERAAERGATAPNPSERATDRAATRAADRSATRPGDYIVAIVNQELVTAVEVERRMQRTAEEMRAAGNRPPAGDALRTMVVEALIEDRVVLTHARESGLRIDEAELDRAVQAVMANNRLTLPQLQARLREDGIDYARFRANLREQLMVERMREREVLPRIRVGDAEIEKFLDEQRATAAAEAPIRLAQVLVSVPDGAGIAEVAQRRQRAEAALARIKAGEAFDMVARELSDDATRTRGGEMEPRPASRLPDLFVDAIKGLKSGDLVPQVLRSGAGFHVLKVLDAATGGNPRIPQIRARHVLLKNSPGLTAEQAQARLTGYRRAVETGTRTFEEIAREYSEDGSAAQGGDLGWVSPGMMVPEFEEALFRLPDNGLSAPVSSRFGWHLIQAVERRAVEIDPKKLRDNARNALREQKFDGAYADWVRDLRARAYVEMREPPQ
jgi:peptidyl-prolyl cis-trans isomerase SurA